MKTGNLKLMLAVLLTAMCVTLFSCTDDCFVQTVEEPGKAMPLEFTPEESRYMVTMQKGNSVDPQEALDKVIEQSGTKLTRGENDLENAGIIYKEEIGLSAKDSIMPDTLAYVFKSKNERKHYQYLSQQLSNEL